MSIAVFIADDHTLFSEGLKAILEKWPVFRVVGMARNGREAVEQIVRLQPDVAILDISMPELNGIEAAWQVRKVSPATRIIMLSMHSTSEYIQRSLKAGASGYLLKESASREVAEAVRSVYHGRRYLCEKIHDTVIDYIINEDAGTKKSPIERLSRREREVLQHVVEGRSCAEIGKLLNLSEKTIATYRSRIMQKTGVSDITGLVKFAVAHGLTTAD